MSRDASAQTVFGLPGARRDAVDGVKPWVVYLLRSLAPSPISLLLTFPSSTATLMTERDCESPRGDSKLDYYIEGREMTLTIELPDTLTEQFREREIPEKEIEAVVLAALEIWLTQQPMGNGGRFAESAVPFVRRLIAQNRELFEMLAQR
jgi:hypothetical protein